MNFYCLHPLQKIWLVNIQHDQTFLRQDKMKKPLVSPYRNNGKPDRPHRLLNALLCGPSGPVTVTK